MHGPVGSVNISTTIDHLQPAGWKLPNIPQVVKGWSTTHGTYWSLGLSTVIQDHQFLPLQPDHDQLPQLGEAHQDEPEELERGYGVLRPAPLSVGAWCG